MREIIKTTATIAAGILMIDAAGLVLWVLSGQYPADSFFVGTITAYILRAIL